ncbi:MAG: hypothetical protein NVS4B8_01080 [Herpetosiphon sp.]
MTMGQSTETSRQQSIHVKTGDLIDHYRIIGPLGVGGMSRVYRAYDEQQHRDVVLKFPHDDMMGDPATAERFRREIKIGKLLNHPHIQKLYAAGGQSYTPYLVFEFVPGCTLRETLSTRHRLTLEETRDIGIQLADALAYAHANHIFHRDLKPENIIRTPDQQTKVMDFGIGFVPGSRRITWGALSAQVGTPDYMAPEQIKGVRGDVRTDIYALGTILYECIAGRLPYRGDNSLSIMNQHVTTAPPPIHQFYKHVSPEFEEVVMKAIRRDPQARWPSMHAFQEALAHPENVDCVQLTAERERDSDVSAQKSMTEFGRPWWQVVAIVVLVLVGLVAFGLAAQLLHHG